MPPTKGDAVMRGVPVGFELVDYEGLESFECARPKCGFQTFKKDVASDHSEWHDEQDAAAEQREALTAAQTPDYGPDPEPPKPKRKAKVKDE